MRSFGVWSFVQSHHNKDDWRVETKNYEGNWLNQVYPVKGLILKWPVCAYIVSVKSHNKRPSESGGLFDKSGGFLTPTSKTDDNAALHICTLLVLFQQKCSHLEVFGISQVLVLLLPQIFHLILFRLQLLQFVQHFSFIRILCKDLLCQSLELLIPETQSLWLTTTGLRNSAF